MIHVNTQGSHYAISNLLTLTNKEMTKVVEDFDP